MSAPIKNLYAVVLPVRYVDASARIQRDSVWQRELARPIALRSPLQQKLAHRCELHHPPIAIAIAHEKGTVWRHGDIGHSIEMRGIIARNPPFSQRHQ